MPDQVQAFLGWIIQSQANLDAAAWQKIADALKGCRRNAETIAEGQARPGAVLVRVINQQNAPTALIAFLHARVQQAPAHLRTAYVNELFSTLLSQPWSAEYEDEAFTLLGQLSDVDDAGQKLPAHVSATRLTDRMIEHVRPNA